MRRNNLLNSNNLKQEIVPGLISVIIPVYGEFDPNRVLISLASILAQKNVNLEIIISEQGEKPRFGCELKSNTKYIFGYHKPPPNLSDFNPGLIRNDAIENSSGEFIYANDADIVFLKQNFLSELTNLLTADFSLALYRPPMRRLPMENFDEFYKKASNGGLKKALSTLDLSQSYLTVLDGKKRKLKVITRQGNEYEKTFTTYVEDFQRYHNNPSLKGKEPLIWSEDRHGGGIFMRREQFNLVGGYCQDFINWGCEDSDLQWKLAQHFNLNLIPKESRYEVLHLDHPKGYFSKEMWKRNEEISAQRKEKGITTAIISDTKSRDNKNG